MKLTKREIEILSEALEDFAIKYVNKKTPEGKLTLGDEPNEAQELFRKLNEELTA